jgi:hypothetical protein
LITLTQYELARTVNEDGKKVEIGLLYMGYPFGYGQLNASVSGDTVTISSSMESIEFIVREKAVLDEIKSLPGIYFIDVDNEKETFVEFK